MRPEFIPDLRLNTALGAALGALILVLLPVVAEAADLAMLGSLAKGEWTVRYRDGSPERRICVTTGTELVQLQHRGSGCKQFVVEDEAARVTVQYTCPGRGYGRTSIRRETASLVQIESQGIAAGQPFQFAAEARRTGSC